ncbi:MAG TPA: lysine N(6)-hydroxylase/L-ornithine N(5)-oxygenase family protein [Micromonosporaceae bacterium]|nr:lysine N(6)-hydroxylase/L-ornithine N(5)-oxygenase family protein [Micromonosporaceae bacterium]
MTTGSVYDVVGVGFGPSNLALAIAMRESGTRWRGTFLEKQSRFGWHRGMLIDTATMQVSFLKDLVTLRDPTSPFSFVSYLHQKQRLPSFINHKTLFPTRVEFHDYLEWAAAAFVDCVEYGSTVVDVLPVHVDGRLAFLDVVAERAGSRIVRRTRNLVLAAGLVPRVPADAPTTANVWHSHELLDRMRAVPRDSALTVTVVGAGQSAAEVTEYVHRCFGRAEVHAVFDRFGYSPADDSPFVNGIFDPAAVDTFFQAPSHVRQSLLRYHGNTNYSAVDADLIDELYRRVYAEQLNGETRLRMRNTSRVASVEPDGERLRIAVEHLPTGSVTTIVSDLLIYATGYRPYDPLSLLGNIVSHCKLDPAGGLGVDRDYRVMTTGAVECGIYLQGGTEDVHGISSSLLSNTAVRAAEITRSIAANGGG